MSAYTVELDDDGCERCGRGKMWGVIDPNGMMLGTTFENEDDAEMLADELNTAFVMGQQSTQQREENRR